MATGIMMYCAIDTHLELRCRCQPRSGPPPLPPPRLQLPDYRRVLPQPLVPPPPPAPLLAHPHPLAGPRQPGGT